jgi:hypothetical protein
MKKKTNWLVTVVAIITIVFNLNVNSAYSAQFVISNDDDVVGANAGGMITGIAARGITQVVPMLGQDQVIITSLASSTSSNLLASRNNAMAGMFRVSVPEDRNTDPSAWYWIPSTNMQPLGLQWFDMVTTTFKSWKGSTIITNSGVAGEYGHRIVVHVTGSYPVSAYTITVSSSLTNIPATTFNVATNTSTGLEIPFNQNFIGGNVGADGTNQSYWSTVYGSCIQVGDDSIFQSGQMPSTNSYNWFLRFGSTISINVSSLDELEAVRKQFAIGHQWIKVTLKKNGVTVAEQMVHSAMPESEIVGIDPLNDMVRFMVVGGQENSPYGLESCLDVANPVWTPYLPGNPLFSGEEFSFPVEKSTEKRFFRAKALW